MQNRDCHHSKVNVCNHLPLATFSKQFDHVPIPHGHSQFVKCVRWTHKNSPGRPLFLDHRTDSIPAVSVSKKPAYRALEIRVDRSPSAETELRLQDTVGSRHFRQNFVGLPFWMALLLQARKFRYLKMCKTVFCVRKFDCLSKLLSYH